MSCAGGFTAALARVAVALLAAVGAARAQNIALPAPTGPLVAGTASFAVDRSGVGAADNAVPRRLVVTAWYPAADTTGRRRAPYLRAEAALQAMSAAGSRQATTALSMHAAVTHAFIDAPVLHRDGRLPVIVFSHGYTAMPSDYTALMEELASQGYAVFSIAHTGESMAVTLPDGHTETIFGMGSALNSLVSGVIGEWGAEDSVATAVTSARTSAAAEATLRWYLARIPKSTLALDRWVRDTRDVVDEIERLAAPGSGSLFANTLDLSRLGALGHSMGGVTSAAYCAADSRCRAAINLDGSPQYGDLMDHPSRRPFLMVYGDRPGRVGVSDVIYAKGIAYWRAVVHGALHVNFGDWQFWNGPARMSNDLGPIDAARLTEIERALVEEFFTEQFGGSRSSLLSGQRRIQGLDVRRISR